MPVRKQVETNGIQTHADRRADKQTDRHAYLPGDILGAMPVEKVVKDIDRKRQRQTERQRLRDRY